MPTSPSAAHPRVTAHLPYVAQVARRVATRMPPSVDFRDLVQDGVLGLIDAAQNFDDTKGIKFETFAERRIRGAMIDVLRKTAWPRGIRRQRRELEAARDTLRAELGAEPSHAQLAARIGCHEQRLSQRVVRIASLESMARVSEDPTCTAAAMPVELVPAQPEQPDAVYDRRETNARLRAAIAALPARDQHIIRRYYYGEATMKDVGRAVGVNESRVSQLHARALRRLRELLETRTAGQPLSASVRDASSGHAGVRKHRCAQRVALLPRPVLGRYPPQV